MKRGQENKERGIRNEARIVEMTTGQMMSRRQIAEAMGFTLASAFIYTDRLHDANPKRLYVAGHQRNTNGRPEPLFMAGNLPDVEFVSYRKPKLAYDRVLVQFARVAEVLGCEPSTAEEVGEAIARSTGCARDYISQLRKARPKQAYIKEWRAPMGRGDLAPVYALGNKKDAPKPRQTRAERFAKEKANRGRYEGMLFRKRAEYRKERGLPPPPLPSPFAALGL